FPHISHAQKILGADITYKVIAKDSFIFTVTAYVFCDSTGKLFKPGNLTVYPENATPFTVALDIQGGEDITPVSRTSCTKCSNDSCSLKYGVQQYALTAIVSIHNYKGCNFKIGWQGKNRKIDGKPIYVEAFINKCVFRKYYFNSPYFTNPPVLISSYNNCNVVSLNANSDDLFEDDSLAYSLVNARYSKDSVYNYPTGYDSLTPLSVSSSDTTCKGFFLDKNTGIIYFNPAKKEDAVVAGRIETWAKDSTGKYELAVSITRDLQYVIMDTDTNKLPTISGINGKDIFEIEICANQTKCFSIHASDINSSDTVIMSANVSMTIPSANFEVTSGLKFPKGTFCWTPSNPYVRTYPYKFQVTVVDNRSPINGRSNKVFSVKVRPAPKVTYTASASKCGLIFLQAKGDSTYKYEWIFDSEISDTLTGKTVTVQAINGGYTKYRLKVTTKYGCMAIYYDSILTDKPTITLPKNQSICFGDTIKLNPKIQGSFVSWSPDSFISSVTELNPKFFPAQTTKYKLTIKDSLGCFTEKEITIKVNKLNYSYTSDKTICLGDSVLLELKSSDYIYHYNWNTKFSFIGQNKSYYVKPDSTTTYILRVRDTNFCSFTHKINIKVNSIKLDAGSDVIICKGDSTKLAITGNSAFYKWKKTAGIKDTTSASPFVSPTTTTTYYVTGYDSFGCFAKDSVTVNVDTSCVWPGDANRDKTADYLDILDIALGYSTVGTPRINGSVYWGPQLSLDWSNSLSSGINYKHLDTNGDSIIDANDTFAVAHNYGKKHLKNEEPQLTGNPNDPPLYFQFDKKYYLAGDTVKAALYVGSADKPVNNVYGLGMKHFFANPYMQSNSYSFSWNCEMLCGAKDNFQLYRQFNDKGTGEGSIIRTDKLTTSKPFGKVADMEFILKDSTFSYPSGGTNISIDILKSKLIDMNGNEIPVYTKSDIVKIYRTQNDVVGMKENHNLKSEINIYPNPANNLVYIDGGEQRFNEITMVNLLGETVAFSNLQTSKTCINIAHLSAGIYFIRVRSGNQFSQHKLVITR
ncbi:MAG: T9SS type A sorting domain-containing protein, partial [Bacteroidia bacterium]